LLGDQGLPPGRDFYDEGYLLDSDHLPVVFRIPDLPKDFQVNDILGVEGYFIQRYNFKNRMNEATWTPMVVAGKVWKIKAPSYGLTTSEQWWAGGAMVLLLGFFVFVALRPKKPARRLRVRKKKGEGDGQSQSQGKGKSQDETVAVEDPAST